MQLTTIRAAVCPATITKVTRLFNGTLQDVAHELFQNARRAGATRIVVHSGTAGDQPTLTVCDDGCGIDDPASVLTLGQSSWTDRVKAAEDPAGMGVFSLAGRRVTIESWSPRASASWKAVIPADAWDGSQDIALSEGTVLRGTAITIDLPLEWAGHVASAVADAAFHLPIPVELDRTSLAQGDFLAGAVRVAQWNGSRIGIFEGHATVRSINFHGVTVSCRLPQVRECDTMHLSHHARLDIGDTPSLQLVLPARKEAVESAGLAALREAVEIEIYRTIATKQSHRLPYHHWQRAAELGIALDEAEQVLGRWHPQVADSTFCDFGTARIAAADAILTPTFSAVFAQPLARAAARHPFRERLAIKNSAYIGYGWYDALTTIADARLVVTLANGTQMTIDDEEETADLREHCQAAAIEAQFDIIAASGSKMITIPTDVAFGTTADIFDGLDAARVVWTGEGLTVDDLANLLDAAFFCASHDRECDSWDTQHRAFEEEALAIAASILVGEDAAVAARLQRLVRDHVWLVPGGRHVTISIIDRRVEVTLVPVEQVA